MHDNDPDSEPIGPTEHSLAGACPGCVLRFDTAGLSPEAQEAFDRGFEAGAVWSLIDDPAYETVTHYVHGRNAEMVIRMAEATGRSFRAEPDSDDDEMLLVVFGPSTRVPEGE